MSRYTRDDLKTAVELIQGKLATPGGSEILLLDLGIVPAELAALASQRALRVYAYLTGQIPGPISKATPVLASDPAVTELGAAWLNGSLAGLHLPHDPGADLSHARLAWAASELDRRSEARAEQVMADLGLPTEVVIGLSTDIASRLLPRLIPVTPSMDTVGRLSALASLWQDGLCVALVARLG